MQVTAQSSRTVRWAPPVGWAATAAVLVAAMLLSLSDPTPDDPGAPDAIFLPLFFAMAGSVATVGALLALRQSSNPIGWMLLAGGALMAVTFFSSSYAQFSYGTGRSLPAAQLMTWLPVVTFPPALVITGLVILIFPSGRLPRLGMAILAVILVGLALTDVAGAVKPGLIQSTLPAVNPFGVEAMPGVRQIVEGFGNVLLVIGFVLATASLAARFRAAHGEERKQIEWFAYVAVILAGSLALATAGVGPISDIAWPVSFAAFTALPIAIAVAVLKYRLYDIDRLVNRTLVYVPLVGILGGLYTASVAFFQRMFLTVTGAQSDAAIVMTTLLVAGTFTPVRRSLEAAVERRFRPSAPPSAAPLAIQTAHLEPGGQIDVTVILDDPRLTARMEEIARRVAAGEPGDRDRAGL
jgi:hypothetical protein